MTGLTYEYSNLPLPVAVETTDTLNSYLEKHPEVNDVLVLDDGIYSGTHLITELQNLRGKSQKRIDLSIIIAYGTTHGKKRIEETATYLFNSVQFYLGATLPIFSDYLSPELRKFADIIGVTGLNNTLSYYDHVMPDFMSTHMLLDSINQNSARTLSSPFQHMLMKGYYLDEQQDSEWLTPLIEYTGHHKSEVAQCIMSKDWNDLYYKTINAQIKLIPIILRPYRLHNPEYFELLKKYFEAGDLGVRTAYSPPDRFIFISQLLNPISEADQQKITCYLTSHFDEPLNALKKKIHDMDEILNQNPNSNYKVATEKAHILLNTLEKAKAELMDSRESLSNRKKTFQDTCQNAINEAKHELQTHRGWKQILANIASVVCSVLSFGSLNVKTGRSLFGLFPTLTDSGQKLAHLERSLLISPS